MHERAQLKLVASVQMVASVGADARLDERVDRERDDRDARWI